MDSGGVVAPFWGKELALAAASFEAHLACGPSFVSKSWLIINSVSGHCLQKTGAGTAWATSRNTVCCCALVRSFDDFTTSIASRIGTKSNAVFNITVSLGWGLRLAGQTTCLMPLVRLVRLVASWRLVVV